MCGRSARNGLAAAASRAAYTVTHLEKRDILGAVLVVEFRRGVYMGEPDELVSFRCRTFLMCLRELHLCFGNF